MLHPIPGGYMSGQIETECFTKELYDLLSETFEQTQGIYLDRGTSLLETLETISAEQASVPVPAQGESIAAHVNHICYYLDVLEGCIQRKTTDSIDWQASWELEAVTAEEWKVLKMRLKETYHRVLVTMNRLDAWEGEDDIGASLAILAHTACHLGMIQLALRLIS
jgi:hypothetical protein